MKDCDLEKEEVDVLLKPYQENINKLLSGSGDKELLTDVMGAMNRPECRDMLMQKYHKGLADSVSRPKSKNIAPFRGIER